MRGELLYDLYRHDDSIPASLQKLLIEQQLELPGACNDILAQIFSCSTEPKVGSEILPYTDRLNSRCLFRIHWHMFRRNYYTPCTECCYELL